MKQHSGRTSTNGKNHPAKPGLERVRKGNAFYAPQLIRPAFSRTMICRHRRWRSLCPECSPLR
jgi:hypothetical protein